MKDKKTEQKTHPEVLKFDAFLQEKTKESRRMQKFNIDEFVRNRHPKLNRSKTQILIAEIALSNFWNEAIRKGVISICPQFYEDNSDWYWNMVVHPNKKKHQEKTKKSKSQEQNQEQNQSQTS